jgi:hypothetical protein
LSTYLPKSTGFVPAGTDLAVKLLTYEGIIRIRVCNGLKVTDQP